MYVSITLMSSSLSVIGSNQKKGVDFRRWANKVLKEYLIKGYAVNKALTEQRYTELKQLVNVLGRV